VTVLFMLDTNVLSEHLKDNPRIVSRAGAIDPDDRIAISNLAWFEIIRGRASALTTANDLEQLLVAQSRLDRDLEALDRFVVYGVTESAARHFVALRTNRRCKKMSRADLLIACIALANQAVLVTRNVKDFSNVPNLRIQNWFN
jgi:predicted nucleic acid-binding protein